MQKLLLPSTFSLEETSKPHEGRLVIEPLFRGYGTTLGNALRRVLLSSLPGAAVVAVKIKGVPHEFGTIEHVKEDVVEIILQLKQLRLRVFNDEEVRLHLEVKGERVVTAYDIEPSAEVEIVNPQLHLATLTDAKACFEMDLFVRQGRGYVPVEEQGKLRLELGTIAIDSIFTPVINVGYNVEQVRVGEITNYEKLIMTIETDSTITSQKAVLSATTLLVDHLNLLVGAFGGGNSMTDSDILKDTEEAQTEQEEIAIAKDENGESKVKPKTKKKATKKKK
ncbi:MAG: DNA-directed RNA polymerase subunit alpha [Candidatus Magasanikbacteria bacterium GW2011_GWA2_45_39]|uniref:DNA-directed RNA polymerase subunit alpha n=2 Tax=Candidatus Magasanikiibacteriota TaxID=1752731 RepID=A0A0G1N0I7_9BACT|nr:MAG: DNA-directed RNA polymerase subunit alpha [Candidatus Magasanikbacteria bacterium GW2011_GWA2_45_39]KKU14111.1 MAG: DNA-directed RNA polymerase subunit alpha [Candidatus Magasanikbacteria bacterium GW2011_GWC2_45_8]HBW73891.1 DNA-directed RNA polymerase subunit alpha [Candidatus Magasanikbacteria bacterium]